MKARILSVFLALALLLAACGPAEAPAETPQAEPELAPLKVALLPILDSLPYYVAAEEGYFAEEGLDVEVVPVSSAVERDNLMQAAEIDGMLNELASVAVFNRDEVQIQAVITARKAYPDAPLFRVLAAPGSGISSPADLAGVPIGISENTIIEYVTDRLLMEEGLAEDQIAGQAVPAIPERFQLLMEGQIEAATLPDPLAQSAVESGAVLVIDDSAYPQYAVSVLSFSTDALANKAGAVNAFLRAWSRAAEAINANPEAYRGLLLEKVRVPENVQETYEIPPFPTAEVPEESQWQDVVAWLVDKDLIPSADALPYHESVTPAYLPEN